MGKVLIRLRLGRLGKVTSPDATRDHLSWNLTGEDVELSISPLALLFVAKYIPSQASTLSDHNTTAD